MTGFNFTATHRPATQTAWMVIDRATGNSVYANKNETKVRAKCENLNGKANREATYVRPFNI